ncbi:ADP-glyceromanno-heptose 6-epimerase [Acetobacter vaccinii]|uniref:ADP-L-glycero-D-manno-heptose-6-epimerase n=1 Tax=Acetobacter vaccinii TaxID=2592655 RepID=A0A5C1YPG0_9PROT|nr:ADP-glyceromanno-heptose 6-epimerase [Acetobacter vaccinii]QEO17415.1 ADP-glyceromanno-heptose 6-epimerase [Acetobacter vaccinii]
MIIITGGAGFVGSCLQAALVARGQDTVIVDWLGTEGKWRNIAGHPPVRVIDPHTLPAFLDTLSGAEAVFHMGAISETTARDGDLVWQTNVALSQTLWKWCTHTGTRFVYASSAATYGAADKPEQFSDDPSLLDTLHPLNLYGWSKHVFDRQVVAKAHNGGPTPPQWAGLKFFNVYGPNEYHKGRMLSVVKVKYDEVRSGQPARLFRSDRPDLADGMQARDFIWVQDVVDIMLWLYDTPDVSGLFNCGTGVARTYLDLAYAVCDAAGCERRVEFVDMPPSLHGQYQSYTQADLTRLRAAGYTGRFTTLEEGVRRYVQDYLATPHPYY